MFQKINLAIKLLLLQTVIYITTNAQTNMSNSCKKVGPAYMINMPDQKQAILSVAEIKSADTFTYYLLLNDASTAAIVKKKLIAVNNNTPINYEQVIGCMDNNIWILTDSLVAYNATTLEPVITETDIAAKNLFMQNNFSRRHNSYLLDEAARVMYVGAENGERYKLYTHELLMKPDSMSSDPAPEDHSYEFAAEYKINDRYQWKYALTNIDTFNNLLYILGSTRETSQVLSYFGTGIFADRDEIRQLTMIPYKTDGGEIDYKKNKPVTGIKKYYKAGLLQKKFSTVPWRGLKGEKIIVYYSDTKTKASLSIALVNKDGAEQWAADTHYAPLSFTDYVVSENNLVLWFTAKASNADAESVLISIDLATGKASHYTYQP